MVKRYRASLETMNGTGVDANAAVHLVGRTATVKIDGMSGLTPAGAPHAQHIHGELGMESRCPSPAADDDGDGIVSTAEGLPDYGAVKVSLTTEGDTSASSALATDRFPTEADYPYERTFDVPRDLATQMGLFAIVVHGDDLDGSGAYDGQKRSSLTNDLPLEATVPVVCGEIVLRSIDLPAPYDGATGTEGQIARYYAALLDRAPDANGFDYWVNTARQHGPGAVANAFAESAEFHSRFGDLISDAATGDWVDFVYAATLGRAPDADGKAYWMNQLATGNIARGDLVALFADSAEFRALTHTG